MFNLPTSLLKRLAPSSVEQDLRKRELDRGSPRLLVNPGENLPALLVGLIHHHHSTSRRATGMIHTDSIDFANQTGWCCCVPALVTDALNHWAASRDVVLWRPQRLSQHFVAGFRQCF